MKAGCVQLSDPAAMSGYEEIKDQVELRAADVYEKEQTLSRLGQCVKSLAPYGKKKGLLDKRREVGFGEVLRQEAPKDALEICRKVEELQKETGACKSRISQEEFLQASLAPWRELDLPLEVTGTESSRVLLAAVPVTVTVEEPPSSAAGAAAGGLLLGGVRGQGPAVHRGGGPQGQRCRPG